MISPAYVKDFIARQAANGYSVLVVRGKWPKPVAHQPANSMVSSQGNWFDPREMRVLSAEGFAQAAAPSVPSSSTHILNKGILVVKQAVRADVAGNSEEAMTLYENGLTYLLQAQKRMNPESERASALRIRISEYMDRAEALRSKLDAAAAAATASTQAPPPSSSTDDPPPSTEDPPPPPF